MWQEMPTPHSPFSFNMVSRHAAWRSTVSLFSALACSSFASSAGTLRRVAAAADTSSLERSACERTRNLCAGFAPTIACSNERESSARRLRPSPRTGNVMLYLRRGQVTRRHVERSKDGGNRSGPPLFQILLSVLRLPRYAGKPLASGFLCARTGSGRATAAGPTAATAPIMSTYSHANSVILRPKGTLRPVFGESVRGSAPIDLSPVTPRTSALQSTQPRLCSAALPSMLFSSKLCGCYVAGRSPSSINPSIARGRAKCEAGVEDPWMRAPRQSLACPISSRTHYVTRRTNASEGRGLRFTADRANSSAKETNQVIACSACCGR